MEKRSGSRARRIGFLVGALAFLFGAAPAAAQSTAFSTADQLNASIEAQWGAESSRPLLYRLALEGMRRFPENAEILGRAAWLEYCMGIGDSGEEKALQASSRDPENPSIRTWALTIFWNRGLSCADAERGRALLTKAMELDPSDVGELWYLIGTREASKATPDYDAAVAAFGKAEASGYRTAPLYADRANASLALKRPDLALRDAKAALALAPDSTWAINAYAWAERGLGDYAEWAASLERLLAYSNDDFVKQNEAAIHEQLAGGYAGELGLFSQARWHYRWLASNAPDAPSLPRWLSCLDRLTAKTVTVSYAVSTAGAPRGGQLSVLLPAESRTQTLEALSISPQPERLTVSGYRGNRYALLVYPALPPSVSVTARLSWKPSSLAEGGFDYADPSDDPSGSLGSADYGLGVSYEAGDPRLAALASSIVGGERDPLKEARLIFEWVGSHFSYQVVFPASIDAYLAGGKAECGGYALLFVSLCRACGIPARRVFSPILKYPDEGSFGSHETSEFFVQGRGWVPVNNSSSVFGSTSDVLSLWRGESADRKAGALVPRLEDIAVRYIDASGHEVNLIGG